MFTIEHDFDATVVTLVDDPASHRQEDVIINAFEDCVTIEQLEPTTDRLQRVTLSMAQLRTFLPLLTCPRVSTGCDPIGLATGLALDLRPLRPDMLVNRKRDEMPTPNPAALEFLRTRRSRPAKTLTTPVPSRDALRPLLEAAARTPDHGKLEPWRFIVLERDALLRLAEAVRARGPEIGIEPEKVEKGALQYADAHLAVAVISAPKPSDKIPEIEQVLSAGAVCLALLNAALAAGWGANWLSGWASHDPEFCRTALGLSPGERVAGLIHIGTETSAPPERPRPDLVAITTWVSA